MTLSISQQKVINIFDDFLKNPNMDEMLIEGFPGTGKSFLTKYLIDHINAKTQLHTLIASKQQKYKQIYCTATTNKAATILQKFTKQPTTTIHALLKLRVVNNIKNGTTSLRKTNQWKPIRHSIIFIDECSYIDENLLQIIRESTYKCKLIFIGDKYQLTSIYDTSGSITKNISLQGVLTESIRFSNNSPIDDLAKQLRETIDTGIFKPINYDNKIISHVNGTDFQQMLNDTFFHATVGMSDAKIIAWSNNKVLAYNEYIRKRLTTSKSFEVQERLITNKPIIHPNKDTTVFSTEELVTVTNVVTSTEFGIKGQWLTLDDAVSVFQADNQQDVITYLKQQAQIAKQKKQWQSYFYYKDFFADLRPIHACTVYKAQGSTYKKVFIDLTNIGKCTQPETVARMLHVAVTRASDQVICYGQLPERYSGE